MSDTLVPSLILAFVVVLAWTQMDVTPSESGTVDHVRVNRDTKIEEVEKLIVTQATRILEYGKKDERGCRIIRYSIGDRQFIRNRCDWD